jgi:hypothetical protein
MILSPCKDCEDRALGCHSICERYIDFQKENNRVNDLRKKSRDLDTNFIEIRTTHKKKENRKR